MATPTVSASLDKPTYSTGDTATLTVSYSDPNTKSWQITLTLSDPGNPADVSDPVTVTATIDPSTLKVTDSLGKTWTKVSDSGSVAVYTCVV